MKKKILGGLFLVLLFVSCYVIEQAARKSWSTYVTFGEYQKRTVEATNEDTTTSNQANESNVILENEISKVDQGEVKKIAYLTFDDGPSENTKKVLEVLDQYKIKATFFMVANEITEEREAMVKAMVESGHLIGVHTYTHEPGEIYRTKEACLTDFLKAYNRLYEVTSVKPKVYRFPYGSANCYINNYCNDVIREMNERGMTFYDWNVTAEDSVGSPTASSIIKNISGFTKFNEPVILMHDGASNKLTVSLLPKIIDKIKAAGYEFDTVDHRSNPLQWPHDWKKE